MPTLTSEFESPVINTNDDFKKSIWEAIETEAISVVNGERTLDVDKLLELFNTYDFKTISY